MIMSASDARAFVLFWKREEGKIHENHEHPFSSFNISLCKFMKIVTIALSYMFPELVHDSSYHTLLLFLIIYSACWYCVQ